MAPITRGRPEIEYDPARRVYTWRCWAVSLSGVLFTRCYAHGTATKYTVALNAVQAHMNHTHREETKE